jgi:hypothetical protein
MSHTSFLGIPVEGDISYGDTRVAQRPLEELAPLIQAVLDDPFIVGFGWRQYTPYFNDGEPCVFGAYGCWFRTVEDATTSDADSEDDEKWYDDDTEDLELWDHPTLGRFNWRDDTYEGNHEESYRRARALESAIESGEFHDVLLEAFGDHARVTVSRDAIVVSTYEHE